MSKRLFVFLIAVSFSLIGSSAFADDHKKIKITFFPGGSEGGPFASVVYNGAKAAADLLEDEVDVNYVWSGWNPQKMIVQLIFVNYIFC